MGHQQHRQPTESGLVIPVPSLHDFVSSWRKRVDRVVPVGVPAHVTLLYPFVVPAALDSEIATLRQFFARQGSFSYSLDGTGWFGEEVVFARPSPSAPFISLTNAIQERWSLAPYGGTIANPQPHVTIGVDGEPDLMRQVEEAALGLLPISELASEVWLMQGRPDPPEWSVTHRFPLAGAST